VIIPDGVTTIGKNTFIFCTSITTVSIPDSLTTVSDYAFSDCNSLTDVYYGGTEVQWSTISVSRGNTALTNATIHFSAEPEASDGADYIYIIENGEATITGYTGSGGDITIPAKLCGKPVTNIGNSAFEGCLGLTSVVIPDSVTTIGGRAFYDCQNLASVTVGDCVTTIGEEAFYCCVRLKKVYITDIAAWCNISFAQMDSNPLNYNASLYVNDEVCKDLIIPKNVKEIKNYAFTCCKSLLSVTIPDNITTIGDEAFYFCYNLTFVTVGDGVTAIDNQAFHYCHSLTDVYYNGTEDQWNAIYIGSENEPLTNATIHFTEQQSHRASNGDAMFATLQEALDAYETGIIQLLASAEGVTVNKDAVVDLNGFDIAAVTVNAGGMTVLDSKTDDYTVADRDYGKIATISGNVKSADSYIAIAEADGTSYHKVSLKITHMSLRPANAGVYYKCDINGDEMVAAKVTSYGVALSLMGAPTIGGKNTGCSVFTNFVSGSNTTSTLLKNVLKATNTAERNNCNAEMPVYGRAYIQIGDSYIYGETVSRSFRQQVEILDTIWSTFTSAQHTAFLSMYHTFRESVEAWTIPNIKSSI